MDKNNLEIWESVSKTDEKYTKKIEGRGFRGTSISPAYMVMKATKQFGPYGIGWGVDVVDERYTNGHPVADFAGQPVYSQIHVVRIELWYKWNNQTGRVPAFGQTKYLYKTNDGTLITDEEAPKKSLTDATTKALSQLGFSADIFLGQFDDQEYRQQVAQELALEKSDEEVEKQEEEAAEWRETVNRSMKQIEEAVSLNMLQKVTTSFVKKCATRGDKASSKKAGIACEKRKAELEKQEQKAIEEDPVNEQAV